MEQSLINKSITIEEFLEKRQSTLLVDVRAPIEFERGRIGQAANFPLFSDSERESIGTTYKQKGREHAVLLGMELAGPKMRTLIESVAKRHRQFNGQLPNPTKNDGGKEILVHCARGGMRSATYGWLLEQADFEVYRLDGGYKSYRRYAHEYIDRQWNLQVLTGLTGAGKTELLKILKERGEQVLDLEGLANHRGSAFGGIGQASQPGTEQFENELFEALLQLNPEQPIWVEDESRSIGRCGIPNEFFDQIQAAPAIFVDRSRTDRANFLVEHYGDLPIADMESAIDRIAKRLGGQHVKAAKDALRENRQADCAEILLNYYDKTYLHSKARNGRQTVVELDVRALNEEEVVDRILELQPRLHDKAVTS